MLKHFSVMKNPMFGLLGYLGLGQGMEVELDDWSVGEADMWTAAPPAIAESSSYQ